MIKIIEGDLLNAKTDIIAHQVNCRGAFRSGVAKAIREHNYDAYKDYQSYCSGKTPEKLIGTVRYTSFNNGLKKYAHLFAQKDYGYDGKQYTDLKALRKCFENLRDYALSLDMSIAMPYKIGCVRGGADWNEVYSMIKDIFKDCNVELWRLDRG